MNKIEVVSDKISLLGECPLWDSKKELLYWIDIINGEISSINLTNNILSTITTDLFIGCIALRENGELILGSDRGLFYFDTDTLSLDSICDPEKEIEDNRFNDGKCDAIGRFLAGTTSKLEKDKVGSLYSLGKDLKCKKLLNNIIISNGITWSSDNRIMYYIDSPTRKVRAYDYDINSGTISNERTVIKFDDKEGYPDGMTIDIENMLWIAHWGGYKVGRWDPSSGKMIGKIDLPVKRVSSVTFGGKNLDELFITTAVRGFSEDIDNDPNKKYDGMLFKVQTKIKGFDAYRFAFK